ncbi:MAG: HlyD family efflux transporter periplasmic adaptor subunit [Planctomycetota bacterium]|nr:HlyD family efflux transporter periplasmic adaptor subunit [Planctomycetota bacterium]
MTVGIHRFNLTLLKRPKPVRRGILYGILLSTLTSVSITNSASADKPPEADSAKFQLSGTVEAVKQHKVTADTKQFSSLKIKSVAEHGQLISKGVVVVEFETEPYEKRLIESSTDLQLAEITFSTDELGQEQSVAKSSMDREAAERVWTKAKEAFQNYMDVDRERSIRAAEFSLKQSLATLRNAEEELKQLEQMYREDDLTEESEEIVLKRAKQAVESALFRHEGAEIQAKRTLEQDIPRTREERKETIERAELSYQETLHNLEADAKKLELEFAKKEIQISEQREKHQELEEDRARLVIEAAGSGIVVHGELLRGKLADKPPKFTAGTTVSGEQVILTILDPSALQIRVAVPEAHIQKVRVGTPCIATFPAVPDQKVEALVESITSSPFASTQYDCVISIPKEALPQGLSPLMSATVDFLSENTGKESADTENTTEVVE